MIKQFRQYKSNDYQAGMDANNSFAGMSKSDYPQLAAQIDQATQLYRKLAILQAKYMILEQQSVMAKQLLEDGGKEKSEKEVRWLNMMYSHLTFILSKYYETKILPIKAELRELQVKYESLKKS